MQSTINLKMASLVAGFAFFFGFALQALAYTDLEVEIDIYDDGAEVEVSYVNSDDEDVDLEYESDLTDLDDIIAEIVEKLDDDEIDADAIEDVAEVENEDGSLDADKEDAQESLDDAEDAIDAAQEYLDGLDEDSDEVSEGNEKLDDARDLLAEAQTAFDEDDYETAEEKADDAEDLAEMVFKSDDDDDEDEDDDKDRSKFCERTKKAAGWGVAKKCHDQDGWEINDKLGDKIERFSEMKNFGKTTDRVELQSQLRQLLELLIELLQAQMALKSS